MSRMAKLWGPVLCVLLSAVTKTAADHTPTQRVSTTSAGWPIGDYALIDQDGNGFGKHNFQDRWTLLVLSDKRCGAPCAEALAAVSGLLRRIAGTRALQTTQAVVLSLDADVTVADLRRLIAPCSAGLIAVRGAPQELAQAAKDFDVPYPTPQGRTSKNAEDWDHAGSIWLIGPDGAIRAELLPPFDVLLVTAEYLKARTRG